MPSVSKKQQQAAGIATEATEEGKTLPPTTPAGQMQQGMNLAQLKEFASTKTKGLPTRKKPPTKKKAAAAKRATAPKPPTKPALTGPLPWSR